ncbi:MAG TPA: flagellar motor protein [Burkholderiales bacterium]|jgi:chemotaxis protein MotA|nr:flagellar motor protein [Burkholderiales bacterium]
MFYMTLAGLALALISIFSGQAMEGASLLALLHPAAFVLVFGGTLGAVVAQSSPRDFRTGLSMLRWLRRAPVSERKDYISEIVAWSTLSYRQGALKLDRLSHAIADPMMKSGLEMIADQHDPETIRDTLMLDVRIRDARLKRAARMWEAAGAYAPTVGILGSVIGLLHVMNGLNDPTKLGAGIAGCFTATIYGLGLANLVFLPLAAKLRGMIFELTLRDELRIDGLIMIAQNKQPRMVERSLIAAGERASNVVNLRTAA